MPRSDRTLRRRLDPDARRSALLAAATAAFAAQPYDAVTLAAIAKDAGASPALLYRYFDGKDALYAAVLTQTFDELAEWRRAGWFDAAAWDEGWAKGLLPLASGRAAFALVSAEYLSPIPEARRGELEFLPFPRRPGDAPWSIGSATFLGALPGTDNLESARLLVRFLSSPGIAEELTRLTGKPFFSWIAKSGAFPTVVPAWLEAAATTDFDALAREALR